MNITINTTIRDRGQITLPYSMRERSDWLATNSPIQVTLADEKIIIRPPHHPSQTPWNKIWDALHLAQSFTGKNGNISSFILKDRHYH